MATNAELTAQVEELTKTIEGLEADASHDERVKDLNERLASITDELADTEGKLAAESAEVERLKGENEDLVARLDAAKESYEANEKTIANLRSELEAANNAPAFEGPIVGFGAGAPMPAAVNMGPYVSYSGVNGHEHTLEGGMLTCPECIAALAPAPQA